MKTIKKIPVELVLVKYIPDIMEENTIYLSETFSISIHKCLCGCGTDTVLILNDMSDPKSIYWKNDLGWNYIITNDNKITFTPSILNQHCPNRYHYVITNGIANVI